VPDLLRRLPAREPAGAAAAAGAAGAAGAAMGMTSAASEPVREAASGAEVERSTAPAESTLEAPARPAPEARRGSLEPLSATQYLLRATVGAPFAADLELARAALSHQHPGASLETVLHEGLRALLVAAERRRRGTRRSAAKVAPAKLASAPEAARAPEAAGGRYIAVAVRDEVWQRDGGRCAFVGSTGHVCGSTHRVEFHHIIPFARGGRPTASNISVRCKSHNQHEARLDFGDERIDRAIAVSKPRARKQPAETDALPTTLW
jgi:hypothetical protein